MTSKRLDNQSCIMKNKLTHVIAFSCVCYKFKLSWNVKGFRLILDSRYRSSCSFTSKPAFRLQFIINKIWSSSYGAAWRARARTLVARNEPAHARYRPPRPPGQRRGKFARN